jgi:hypothetical protein
VADGKKNTVSNEVPQFISNEEMNALVNNKQKTVPREVRDEEKVSSVESPTPKPETVVKTLTKKKGRW